MFDAVVAGQAWHWIDPVAGAAKAAEALRPRGRLAVFWNIFQPSADVAVAFADIYRRVPTDLPFRPWAAPPRAGYSAIVDQAAGGVRATGAFGPAERWEFGWCRTYSRDQWLDQVPTHGGHSRLPPAQLEHLLQAFATTIDAMGGSVAMDYVAVVLTATRAGAAPPSSGGRRCQGVHRPSRWARPRADSDTTRPSAGSTARRR